ncbi:hypothetical protein HGA88_01015 [Candidatus Roizmanbacteria bacterium]|nr:hypothetical protein [Candidatus Roizmanbacteria bacterium]
MKPVPFAAFFCTTLLVSTVITVLYTQLFFKSLSSKPEKLNQLEVTPSLQLAKDKKLFDSMTVEQGVLHLTSPTLFQQDSVFKGKTILDGEVVIQGKSNIPSLFSGVLTIQGKTGNVQLLGSQGISIEGTLIKNTGILSLSAGSGISVDGSLITNADKGSSQNIFKTLHIPHQTDITASSNNDSFTVQAGAGISISSDSTAHSLTISGVDLSQKNNWSGIQTFQAQTNFPFGVWDSGGNIGIGVLQPTAALELGAYKSLRITGGPTFPSSPNEGEIYFNTDTKEIYLYAEQRWQAGKKSVSKIVAASNSPNKAHADYIGNGTEDQIVIQSAIDSLPAGGRIVLLAGTYHLSQPIILKDNITLEGEGWNSTSIRINDATDMNAIETNGSITYNGYIHDLQIDGNKQNNSSATKGSGIYAALDHVLIQHVRFINIKKNAINICTEDLVSGNLCYLNYVIDNEIVDADVDGIRWDWPMTDSVLMGNNVGASQADLHFGGSTGRIMYNHLDGDAQYNILIDRGAVSYLIANNIIEHAAKNNIFFQMPSWEGTDMYHDINISNNLIRGCSLSENGGYDCIRINGYSATNLARGFTITGNTIEEKDMIRPNNLIHLTNVDQATITGNDMANNGIIGESIQYSGVVTHSHILGNTNTAQSLISGNLGLGTSDASQLLTLNGGQLDITQVSGGQSLLAGRIQGDSFDRISIDSWGNVLTIGSIYTNYVREKDPNQDMIIQLPNTGHNLFFTSSGDAPLVTISSTGNVGIGTTNPSLGPLQFTSGAYVDTAGTWHNGSDVNKKTNFSVVDPSTILSKINALPISQWNYKIDDPSVRHIGPMAQDFFSIFGLGGDDKTISTVDSAGVAFIGIQALSQQVGILNTDSRQTEATINSHTNTVATLSAELVDLQNGIQDTNKQLGLFAQRLSFLEEMSQIASQSASTLGIATQSGVLTIAQKVAISDDLTVTGKTKLNDVNVFGTFTSGILSVDGLAASASATISAAGTLKLQTTGLGDLEIMNGGVIVDTFGNLKVEHGNMSIKEGVIMGNATFRGRAIMPTGATEITIHQNWKMEPEVLNITSFQKTAFWVENRSASGFTIKIDTAAPRDIEFDWLAVW